MSDQPMPQTGGSYIRDEKGGLKKVAGPGPTKPAAKPAKKEG
jgi:hypothetical protein